MKRKAFAKASRHEHILVGLALSLFILLWGAADLAAVDERYRKLLILPSPNTTQREIRLTRFMSHRYKRMAWRGSDDKSPDTQHEHDPFMTIGRFKI